MDLEWFITSLTITLFYDRQFITRENKHQGMVEAFSKSLYNSLNWDKVERLGSPSVRYFAEEL